MAGEPWAHTYSGQAIYIGFRNKMEGCEAIFATEKEWRHPNSVMIARSMADIPIAEPANQGCRMTQYKAFLIDCLYPFLFKGYGDYEVDVSLTRDEMETNLRSVFTEEVGGLVYPVYDHDHLTAVDLTNCGHGSWELELDTTNQLKSNFVSGDRGKQRLLRIWQYHDSGSPMSVRWDARHIRDIDSATKRQVANINEPRLVEFHSSGNERVVLYHCSDSIR